MPSDTVAVLGRLLGGILLVVVFVGCATHWTHPTKPAGELEEDRFECEMRAADAFPPAYLTETEQSGSSETVCTKRAAGGVECVTKGPVQQTRVIDASQGARRRAAEQCMAARGWRKI
jgi:hypothetical protein